MHISIPYTEEKFEDEAQQKGQYTSYHIYVNGVFHCAQRFSQLFNLNEKLKAKFGELVQGFPAKKILALSPDQVEERRKDIEVYLQKVSQEPAIVAGGFFGQFLEDAQKAQYQESKPVELPIHLVNGTRIFLACSTSDRTDDIFEALCREIELPINLTYYFGLFVTEAEGPFPGRIIRQLQDFEFPYLSLLNAPRRSILQFRKAYWSRPLDQEVFTNDKNDVAFNVLYIQTVNDIKAGHIDVPVDVQPQLAAAKKAGDRKKFLSIVSGLKEYGQMTFNPANSSFPALDTECVMCVQSGGIKLKVAGTGGEHYFPVSRIRCWKITGVEDNLELSFHFLKAKDVLEWIHIKTPHGIFASMCLQSIVDELIRLKRGEKLRVPVERSNSRVRDIHRVEPSADTLRALEEEASKPKVNNTLPQGPAASRTASSSGGWLGGKKKEERLEVATLSDVGKDTSDKNAGFSNIGDDDL